MKSFLKLDGQALLFFVFSAGVGFASHAMLASAIPELNLRQANNLTLGLGYDVQGAAMVTAIAIMGGRFFSRDGRRLLLLGLFFLYCLFVLFDYIYVLNLGTHLPLSTLEYLKDYETFSSTVQDVFSGVPLLLLVLAPSAGFWVGVRRTGGKPRHGSRWPDMVGTLVLVLIAGGAAGSYANSYVAKNMNDPLTSSALIYFYWSRNLETVTQVEKPAAALARVGATLSGNPPADPGMAKYPLVRDVTPEGCRSPSTELARRICGVQRPNILFLMLESFRTWEIGAYGARRALSPRFDELAREGIFFTNFFANGFQTRHGKVAGYCSLMPNYGVSIMKAHYDVPLNCLPRVLTKMGYRTSWVHGGDASFDDAARWIPKMGFAKLVDRFDFDKSEPILGWGYSDRALFRKWLKVLDGEPEPFFSSALTLTLHHPFDVPDNFEPELRQYDRAFRFTDEALYEFVRELQKREYYKRTVLFIFADTANYQNPEFPPPEGDMEAFLRLRSQSPLLILGGAITAPMVVESYHSQVDLGPTAMDLIGQPYRSHFAGRSMLADPTDALAFTNRPGNYWAVLGPHTKYISEADQKDHNLGDAGQTRELKALGQDWIDSTRWLLQEKRYWPEGG